MRAPSQKAASSAILPPSPGESVETAAETEQREEEKPDRDVQWGETMELVRRFEAGESARAIRTRKDRSKGTLSLSGATPYERMASSERRHNPSPWRRPS